MRYIKTNKVKGMDMFIKENKNAKDPNIVSTEKIGSTVYGLLKEGGNYIVKKTSGKTLYENFDYINGYMNRMQYAKGNLKEALRYFNLFIAEQRKYENERMLNESETMEGEDPCWDGYEMIGTKKKGGKDVPNCVPKNEEFSLNEDDTEYVIKTDAPASPSADDIDIDADIDMDVEDEMDDEQAPEIEADLEEYQELTGKLAYILRSVDENDADAFAKYIFNSLIAAMPEVSEDVSSSLLQKMQDALEGETEEPMEDEGGEEEQLEETLKKKGLVISEKYSCKQALKMLEGYGYDDIDEDVDVWEDYNVDETYASTSYDDNRFPSDADDEYFFGRGRGEYEEEPDDEMEDEDISLEEILNS